MWNNMQNKYAKQTCETKMWNKYAELRLPLHLLYISVNQTACPFTYVFFLPTLPHNGNIFSWSRFLLISNPPRFFLLISINSQSCQVFPPRFFLLISINSQSSQVLLPRFFPLDFHKLPILPGFCLVRRWLLRYLAGSCFAASFISHPAKKAPFIHEPRPRWQRWWW